MNKATHLSANSKTLILSVEGMTCAACAARIERVLDKEETVEDVVVNFPLKKAVIELNTEDVNSENYIEKIRSVGYSAQEEIQVEDIKNYKRFFIPIISLLSTLALNPLIEANQDFIALGISSIIIFIFGRTFHSSALKSIRNLNFNMDTLIFYWELVFFCYWHLA